MSECRECEPLLAAYVDGEAPGVERDRVERHVEACSCCRDRLAGQRAAREVIQARRQGIRECAPDGLKARCASFAARNPSATTARAARPGPAAPSFGWRARRWVPVSVAATLVLAVAGVFALGLTNKAQALALQTTVDHVKCSRFSGGSSPLDASAAAQQWLSMAGWAITVPPAARASGLELRAVRRCAVTDGRVAHLIYQWMGEPLSVYVLPKATLGDAASFVRRFRHEAVMWSKNNRTYIMVTPRERDAALEQVVSYVRATAY